MLFPTYKDKVRKVLQTWLTTENNGEPMDLKWLHTVALYMYANEYPADEETIAGTAIMLYDYERLTADRRK